MQTIITIITECAVEYILGGFKRRALEAMAEKVISAVLEPVVRKALKRLIRF